MGICITGVCGLIVYMVGIFSHFRGVDVELNELVGTWTWIHITYIRSYIQTARSYRHDFIGTILTCGSFFVQLGFHTVSGWLCILSLAL